MNLILGLDPGWARAIWTIGTISPTLIGWMKNIRFTNQSFGSMVAAIPKVSGGGFGWFRHVAGANLASQPRAKRRLKMNMNIPVLPIAGGALVRAFASVLALLTHWLKQLARAQRHRREASVLAGLDRHMLADIGITRSDLRDAFSEPFWDDPTALLRERAIERRLAAPRRGRRIVIENGFRRPATDRPARQAM
jgi:uncharacterized protein YjiS (DUF1127 family)